MNLADRKPHLGHGVFVAPNAAVIGNVKLADNASVFYGSVIRGDHGTVSIGRNSNVQDGCTIRTNTGSIGEHDANVTIGDNVTIGHSVTLNACTVQDEALIGMGASLGAGSVVEKGAMVAAGAVVAPKTTIPAGQIWGGNPAKFLRDMKPEEKSFLKESADAYVGVAADHLQANSRTLEEIAKSKGMVA
jgi:carbonic anhydrase/acetyltransferase-like protein (isoleucine patch superfamily)